MYFSPERPTVRPALDRLARAAAVAIAALVGAAAPTVRADVPAFSGADGAGAAVTGGRGGIVYHVTKLDSSYSDTGPGTLHYGVADANFTVNGVVTPRTIVFDVGGTIWLGRFPTADMGWDSQDSLSVGSNVTIAGQTAPGGITIAGGQIKMNGNGGAAAVSNAIIRNVSIAPGYGTHGTNSISGYHDSYVFDAMDVNSSGVMVDHVSAVFSTDETISANEVANRTTIQYTNMSQGQDYPQQDAESNGSIVFTGHALGSLWSPGSNATSTFSHNLYAHQSTRLPAVQTESGKLLKDAKGNYIPSYTDFRDNVVYNWLSNAGYGSSGEPADANFVNNYYKVGPGGDSATHGADPSIVQASGGTSVFSGSTSTGVYAAGNVRQNLNGTTTTLANSSANSASADYGSGSKVGSGYAIPYAGVTDSAAAAYAQVLAYAGANWQARSAIDARLFNEVATGTGKVTAFDDPTHGYTSAGVYSANSADTEWNKLLALRGAGATPGGAGATGAYARAATYDADGDGMPDVWEHANGTDPAVADNNGSVARDGYTNLESYLNEVAAWPASTALTFANGNATGRYAEIGNWQTGVYKPSRYDVAQINAGTATVDVPGQHAGTLKVGAAAGGASPALAVTGGWVDVAQSLTVGSAANANVQQSAGVVHAAVSVVLGSASTIGNYALSGGTLATPLLTRGGAAGGAFAFTGGTLHADRVTFSLINAGGTLAPGSDSDLQAIAAAAMPDVNNVTYAASSLIGDTRVNGNLTLLSGTLQIDLASPASFDTLTVDQTLALGGTLAVNLLNGYQPAPGDQWRIATASAVTGTFANVPAGYTVQTIGGNVFLAVVPEPSTLSLAALAGVAFLRRTRR